LSRTGATPSGGQDSSRLRDEVRAAYSRIAAEPSASHPFPVGRELAEAVGYPAPWLAEAPAAAVDAFAGISCLPCFADLPAGSRVLDLGCGSGLDSLLAARTAAQVLAVDFSPAMLTRARAAAESADVTNVEFREGAAERIPAESGSIDVAIVNGIFNLNPARSDIFRELARVVRHGGHVFAAELVLARAPDRAPDADRSPLPSQVDWFA
jgi:arsenite methyltransferase